MVVSDHSGGEATGSYDKIKKLVRHPTFPVIYSKRGRKIGGYSELMEYFSKLKM